jgi:methionyl-tRNA formyltransferase
MDIIVIGTGHFTLESARAVLDSGANLKAIISMPQDQLPLNPADLKGFAAKHRIAYIEFSDLNSPAALAAVRRLAPDYILSSWPKILKVPFLKIPKQYVIGSHPTLLPHNRGRHPLHWLIVQGFDRTALSFFQMDEGVDTGRILLQLPVAVGKNDTVADLDAAVNKAGYRGTRELLRIFKKNPAYKGQVQKHAAANYWRKRTPYDVTLDFRMTADQIIKTVRSFALPYPCANLIFGNKVLKVLSAQMVKGATNDKRLEPGKIIAVRGRRLIVKALDQAVDLQIAKAFPADLKKSRYIHPPLYYFNRYFKELSAQLSS